MSPKIEYRLNSWINSIQSFKQKFFRKTTRLFLTTNDISTLHNCVLTIDVLTEAEPAKISLIECVSIRVTNKLYPVQ